LNVIVIVATESLLAAREAYQDPTTGKRIKSGSKLGDKYQEKSLPVVRRRLAQAGLRLAWVLNEAVAELRKLPPILKRRVGLTTCPACTGPKRPASAR
jgi:S1/P1 Nuclease